MTPEEFKLKVEEVGEVLVGRMKEAVNEWVNSLAVLLKTVEQESDDSQKQIIGLIAMNELKEIGDRVEKAIASSMEKEKEH